MEEKNLNKLRKVRLFYIKVKARYNRGNSLIDDSWNLINRSVIIGLGIGLWNQFLPWKIPISVLPFIVVAYVPFAILIGHIDQTKLKITQAENEYGFTFLNPFFAKMAKDIKIIKSRFKWKK